MTSERPLRSVLFVEMWPTSDGNLTGGLMQRGHLGEFASLADALKVVETVPFEAIVAALPFPQPNDLPTFVSRVRASASACRMAALVVLASGEHEAGGRALLGKGVNAVLPRHGGAAALAAELARCAEVAPRALLVAAIRLEVPTGGGWRRLLAQTANVSATGAFIRMDQGLLVGGEVVRFELTMPSDRQPLRGEGEVVRRAQAAGLSGGVAVRFTSISERDRERIAAAVTALRRRGPRFGP